MNQQNISSAQDIQETLLMKYKKNLASADNKRVALKRLKESQGYKVFQEILDEARKMKQRELIAPPNEIVHEEARTYVAGEVAAVTYCQSLVDTHLQALDGQIKTLREAVNRYESQKENKGNN